MNTSTSETTALTAAEPQFQLAHVDAASLMLGPAWDRIQAVGKMMARGAVTIPRHLQGNEADCTAVALQAFGWRMNPFAVAQKTHVSQSGALGYEAQLVNAVIQGSGELRGDPDYEYIGEWDRVLGKVEERKSDKGGKYYVATYTRADEEGLGIIVRATLRTENKPRELKVMMSQAWPRFSTQWATDPKQQISYLALRKFVRLHKPGVILGVNSNDEIEPVNGSERFMGPADVVPTASAPSGTAAAPASGATTEMQPWPDDALAARFPRYRAYLAEGKTHDDIIAFAAGRGTLTEAQKKKIRALKPEAAPTTGQQVTDVEAKAATTGAAAATDAPSGAQGGDDGAPAVTYAELASRIARATTADQIDEAQSLVPGIQNGEHRKELNDKADARRVEIGQGK